MSLLSKGERLCTKLVELFANRVIKRRNMIMSIQREEFALRVLGVLILGGVLSFLILSFSFPFCVALPFFLPFAGFYGFPSSR
jgi:hypothetical protein